MQKANPSDVAHSRRPARVRSARPLLAALLSACAGQTLWFSAEAATADDSRTASSASMQQVIEAARRKKAQELEAAARRLLGTDAPPAVTDAPPAPAVSPPAPPKTVELPRVWSLTGVGRRLDTELLYEGRIHRISVPDTTASRTSLPLVGPWRIEAISPNGVTVSLHSPAAGGRKAKLAHLLPAPSRGSTMAGYAFQPGAVGVVGLPIAGADPLPLSALNPMSLPPSALRASQLPREGQTAMATIPQAR